MARFLKLRFPARPNLAVGLVTSRMGDFYWQMLTGNGYEGEVGASRAAWAARDREASVAAIGDEMVRDIQVIGSLDEVREKLEEREKLGADVQMLYMPPGDVQEVGKTLEALAR